VTGRWSLPWRPSRSGRSGELDSGGCAGRLACGVRTGLSADGEVAWAYHVDHVVTEASSRAASRAIEAAFSGDALPALFHELVRQEQRKMLRIVPGQADED
jgi:hypothetical protein